MDTIEWDPERERWVLIHAGRPTASSLNLRVMERHHPDAKVVEPDEA